MKTLEADGFGWRLYRDGDGSGRLDAVALAAIMFSVVFVLAIFDSFNMLDTLAHCWIRVGLLVNVVINVHM